jgi:Uma2 family endonuclease
MSFCLWTEEEANMSTVSQSAATKRPTHLDLPSEDGTIVHNFQELPLSILLTDTILPRLQKLYPSGWYTIGQDSFIYWRETDPPLDGCKAPDWFVVLGVPPALDGGFRRSYVLWQEEVRPLILLEYVSNDRGEEHDQTPETGKFWVYEQQVQAPYYGIFDAPRDSLELYRLVDGQYQLQAPNERGRYLIPPLGVELGIWRGTYVGVDTAWLRWWDAPTGQLLLTGHEESAAILQRAEAERLRAEDERLRAEEERLRAEEERRRAEAAAQQAEAEKQQREKLEEKLRSLGIDPDTL